MTQHQVKGLWGEQNRDKQGVRWGKKSSHLIELCFIQQVEICLSGLSSCQEMSKNLTEKHETVKQKQFHPNIHPIRNDHSQRKLPTHSRPFTSLAFFLKFVVLS